MSVRSVTWDYEEDEVKLDLVKSAVRKAKRKAEEMMAEIGYSVIGMRSCSDSYHTPSIGEIVISGPAAASEDSMQRTRGMMAMRAVDFGTQLKSRKEISATCTVEFLVRPKQGTT